MEIDKENVVQAVVIMDTFNSHFSPIVNNKPMVSTSSFLFYFIIFLIMSNIMIFSIIEFTAGSWSASD